MHVKFLNNMVRFLEVVRKALKNQKIIQASFEKSRVWDINSESKENHVIDRPDDGALQPAFL